MKLSERMRASIGGFYQLDEFADEVAQLEAELVKAQEKLEDTDAWFERCANRALDTTEPGRAYLARHKELEAENAAAFELLDVYEKENERLRDAIEERYQSKAVSRGDEPENWRLHTPPILLDALKEGS